MLVLFTVANRRRDKVVALEEASGRLDALRITVRLSQRLGFLSNGGYEDLSRDIDEVGRMLGGWLKYESVPHPPAGDGAPVRVPQAITSMPPPAPRRGTGVRYTMTSPTIGEAPQRGRNSIAQGNALGTHFRENIKALKGRDSLRQLTSFAPSGLGPVCIPFPRALPWAIEWLPLRGGSQSKVTGIAPDCSAGSLGEHGCGG
jgi:hypothetical protein